MSWRLGNSTKRLDLDPHALERNDRAGSMMQDRTVSNHGCSFFLMAKEYAQMGECRAIAPAYLAESLLMKANPEVAKAAKTTGVQKGSRDPGRAGRCCARQRPSQGNRCSRGQLVSPQHAR